MSGLSSTKEQCCQGLSLVETVTRARENVIVEVGGNEGQKQERFRLPGRVRVGVSLVLSSTPRSQ
jgi:hypothetical protein